MSETAEVVPGTEAAEKAPDFAAKQYASFEMDARLVRASDGSSSKRKLYEVAVSSEAEISRWYGLEVLEHSKRAIDMSRLLRGAAVLVDHRGDQVGVVESARLDSDKVLRAEIRFSINPRGQEIERDVEDGIRRFISVGYMVRDVKREDRESGKKDEQGNPILTPLYRITRWEPAEVSIVSVPADLSVGVGRSAAAAPPAEVVTEEPAPATVAHTEVRSMEAKEKAEGGGAAVVVEDQRSETQKSRDSETAEIFEMCDQHGRGGLAPEFVGRGLTRDQVAYELFNLKTTPKPPQSRGGAELALTHRDRKRFSYARSVQIALAKADHEHGERNDMRFDGLEAEVHQDLTRKYGPSPHGGVLVPYDLRSDDERWEAMDKRTLDSKTPGKGPETVFDISGPFIELLRNRSVVIQMGADVMSGLTGPVGFPKQTSAGTFQWIGENPGADVADSDMGLGLVQLLGKTGMSSQSYTRQLLAQAALNIELRIRNDLSKINSLGIDRAAIHGLGVAGQPTGIYPTPGINTKAMGGVPDYTKIVDQAAQVADDNADIGALGWITTPLMAGKLKTVPEHATGTMADWIWKGTFRDGTMVGYPARSTGQVSKLMTGLVDTGGAEHGIVFGNWNDLVLGLFGAFEIVVDPYSKKKRAIIELTSYQLVDVAVLHAESFSVSTGATIA